MGLSINDFPDLSRAARTTLLSGYPPLLVPFSRFTPVAFFGFHEHHFSCFYFQFLGLMDSCPWSDEWVCRSRSALTYSRDNLRHRASLHFRRYLARFLRLASSIPLGFIFGRIFDCPNNRTLGVRTGSSTSSSI